MVDGNFHDDIRILVGLLPYATFFIMKLSRSSFSLLSLSRATFKYTYAKLDAIMVAGLIALSYATF